MADQLKTFRSDLDCFCISQWKFVCFPQADASLLGKSVIINNTNQNGIITFECPLEFVLVQVMAKYMISHTRDKFSRLLPT